MEIASRANNFHYNKSLKEFAKKNRQSMTKSAACMWKYLLSGRQMLGYQFRRERPILNYIVDFVCLELLLIVEVDGATHESKEAEIKDAYRDSRLSEVGFTVLRFSSWEVLNNMVDVDVILCDWINTHAQVPPPGPRQRGKS
jgi:very-short-patch-repair endonuclease